MLSLALLVLLMTNTARAVTAGSAQSGLGSSFVSEIFHTYGSPPAARGDTAPASGSRARSRMSGAVPLADTPAKQSRSTRTHAVAALRSLPEVGFSDEPDAPWLGAIQAGLKTHELRLDTHPATARLGPGDSFVAQSPYRALEVRIVRVTTFPDFESAWLAHGTSLVPHAVRAVRTAAEARSAFQSFYNHTVHPRPGRCRVFQLEVTRTIRGTPPTFPSQRAAKRASAPSPPPPAARPRTERALPLVIVRKTKAAPN